jgi:hypothetical protein
MVQDNAQLDVETYDKVAELLGADDNPPEGLILHTASPTGSGMAIVDVWESQEAFDRFREERLAPAIGQVVGEQQGAAPPEVRVYEVHDLVKP